MIDRNYSIWLLVLILIFIVSCSERNIPQYQTNSGCFMPDFSFAIDEPLDGLNLDFPTFIASEGDGNSEYAHWDSLFYSNIFIEHSYDWKENNIHQVFIDRELKKSRNLDKTKIEEALEDIRNVWLNCNIPINRIEEELVNIKKAFERDSIMRGTVYELKHSQFEEDYWWSYEKPESYIKYNSLVLHYSATRLYD